jgi:hypothetical protein
MFLRETAVDRINRRGFAGFLPRTAFVAIAWHSPLLFAVERELVMKKFLILAGGWSMTVVGAILTPLPMPLPFPFPIGITMLLVGFAVLTTHSKSFRRGIQYVRHHNGWLSRGLEWVARHTTEVIEKVAHRYTKSRDGWLARKVHWLGTHLPATVRKMVHRTAPYAHGRKARMRSRNAGDVV